MASMLKLRRRAVVHQQVVTGGASVPSAPTVTSVTPGDTTASVAFSPPASDGGAAIVEYEVAEV